MDGKFKVFYDAEFTGLHRNTSLISIGLVAETGSYFYAEFNDYDSRQVNDWLFDNVINNLMMKDKNFHISPLQTVRNGDNKGMFSTIIKADTREISERLLSWLQNGSGFDPDGDKKQIQFYTDCYAYDWVLLNDIICKDGLALNLPSYLYYIPMDLSTALQLKGIDPDISREEFVGSQVVDMLQNWPVFNNMGGDRCKHNSLWDAAICSWCFHKVFSTPGIEPGKSEIILPVPEK